MIDDNLSALKILKSTVIENEVDAKVYIRTLINLNLRYHFDDEPSSIIWITRAVSAEVLQELTRLHTQLWDACSPWDIFEQDRELLRAYANI